ncbi:unnamed protein product [Blepharisma stoltei]|uniref:Transmembrane protein n=1 Tax=Blepharisma stoltei TaxID=1481888 RepID=A0AAU9I9K0_9CILI|nr:unnamed protein product [Blepharisma stoltei]
MEEHGRHFYYRYYTQCFVFIKKISYYRYDQKLPEAERYALRFMDEYMRDKSYLGGVIGGICGSAILAAVFSFGLKPDTSMRVFILKSLICVYGFYNFKTFTNWGSHFSMMMSMPRVFEILDTFPVENSFIRTETKKFFEELKKEENKIQENKEVSNNK